MSFVDDCYEDMLIEEMMISNSIECYSLSYPSQKVVKDAIQSFRNQIVDEDDHIEKLSRDILKTIARLKKVTPKQKNVLIRMLIERHEDDYELLPNYRRKVV